MDERRVIQIIMHELGWDVNSRGFIIDQDTNIPILFNKKPIAYPYINNTRGLILFEPLTNMKIMKYLFDYFLNEKYKEEGIYFSVFSTIPIGGKYYIEAKSSDGSAVRSLAYYNQLLGYADIMLQLSKAESSNLTHLDNK